MSCSIYLNTNDYFCFVKLQNFHIDTGAKYRLAHIDVQVISISVAKIHNFS